MRRWSHGHSLATGVAGGLLLDHHAFLLAAICFTLGLALGRFWVKVRRLAVLAAHKAYELHDAKVATETARGDNIRATAAAAKRRLRLSVEQAYRQGVEDVLKEQAVCGDG